MQSNLKEASCLSNDSGGDRDPRKCASCIFCQNYNSAKPASAMICCLVIHWPLTTKCRACVRSLLFRSWNLGSRSPGVKDGFPTTGVSGDGKGANRVSVGFLADPPGLYRGVIQYLLGYR